MIKNIYRHNTIEVEKENRIEMIRRYQALYSTEYGKAVIEDILALCKYGSSALGKTTEETYFNLGEQNVGIEITEILNADLTKIQKEQRNEEEN